MEGEGRMAKKNGAFTKAIQGAKTVTKLTDAVGITKGATKKVTNVSDLADAAARTVTGARDTGKAVRDIARNPLKSGDAPVRVVSGAKGVVDAVRDGSSAVRGLMGFGSARGG